MLNKKKVINDPVYGFITLPTELIFDVVQHPYFQRLRRIKQLGLTDMVYPGANHTRFHHALGAMHLMGLALDSLRAKGHEISDFEYEACLLAILLHDLGHGPLSHLLEATILDNVSHEKLSLLMMKQMEEQLGGALSLAVKIFEDTYERHFFNQLVSSQLDIDRLDYLNRDAYFTGVSEGTVGAERIIKMLDIKNDTIVVEEKGIYSVENFLNTRRLMYWQVYFHKTTISSEVMVTRLMDRAHQLLRDGKEVVASDALYYFLKNRPGYSDFEKNPLYVQQFAYLDDYDIWGAIKMWSSHSDQVLSLISRQILDRKLFKVVLSNQQFDVSEATRIQDKVKNQLQLQKDTIPYFFIQGSATNAGYVANKQKIFVLNKNGEVKDIAEASELPNIKAISKIVKKFYLCYPKNLSL